MSGWTVFVSLVVVNGVVLLLDTTARAVQWVVVFLPN